LVAEQPLDHVGQPLDVAVRVHRPHGARDQPIVVEHPHRAERRVLGVDVRVERVVPAGTEPPAVHVGDLVVPADLQRHRPAPDGNLPRITVATRTTAHAGSATPG
jgi:hypothetical protein